MEFHTCWQKLTRNLAWLTSQPKVRMRFNPLMTSGMAFSRSWLTRILAATLAKSLPKIVWTVIPSHILVSLARASVKEKRMPNSTDNHKTTSSMTVITQMHSWGVSASHSKACPCSHPQQSRDLHKIWLWKLGRFQLFKIRMELQLNLLKPVVSTRRSPTWMKSSRLPLTRTALFWSRELERAQSDMPQVLMELITRLQVWLATNQMNFWPWNK